MQPEKKKQGRGEGLLEQVGGDIRCLRGKEKRFHIKLKNAPYFAIVLQKSRIRWLSEKRDYDVIGNTPKGILKRAIEFYNYVT